MKKTVFIVATVCILMALLCVPCFAAETTVVRGDPVDWFGSSSGPYTVTVLPSDFDALVSFVSSNSSSLPLSISDVSMIWSSGNPASDVFTAIQGLGNNGSSVILSISPSGSNSFSASSFSSFTFSVDSLDGLDPGTLNFVGTGSDGFLSSGFSDALTELSIIVSAILSNQYILIAIGLAVAVPLVAWGISKIKSLVKGY